jgi:hypothetical protein
MITKKSQLDKVMNNRNKLINSLLKKLEARISSAQKDMYDKLIDDVIDKLDVDAEGRVKNSMANKRLLNTIDTVYNSYSNNEGLGVAQTVAAGVRQVVDFQKSYYSNFTTKASLLPIHPLVKETVDTWLGIGDKGRVEKNGYLIKIAQVADVKQTVKDMMIRGIVGQQGWQETKQNLKDYIQGNPNEQQTGALNRYARNFVYDTYSQIDRTTGRMYADKLGFQFAVYEGGIIKTTREFCRDRNGKVFHISEIEAFKPGKAEQPNYNPVTDLGGWACRHHLNWIPESLAIILRPDASKFLQAA